MKKIFDFFSNKNLKMVKKESKNKFENEQVSQCDSENCERHGICSESMRHHRGRMHLPHCLREI